MSKYTNSDFNVEFVSGIKYKSTSPLSWELLYGVPETSFTIKEGFIFDVSIPWWARGLFNPHNKKYLKAAYLHDWLLSKGYSKALAASVFYDALKSDKVKRLERWTMFLAVLIKTVK
jgi:hypothetical protein